MANEPSSPMHARLDASAITSKPHSLSTSPPPPGSPMPPTASLTTALDTSSVDGSGGATQPASTTSSAAATTTTTTIPSASGNPTAASKPPSPPVAVAPPPEVEATLTRLTSHKNVTGCLVLSRPDALIIRSGGKDFDPSGPGAHDRSEKLRRVVKMVKATVDTLGKSVTEVDAEDDIGFLRIRTKKYEMMISPSDKYLLVVLQDPNIAP